MTSRLLSVNLAVPRSFSTRDGEIPTGIFKEPADRRVRLGRLGLAGDIQADKRVHGGPEKAVYVYASENAVSFTRELGLASPPLPGFFGENFTTEGEDLLESTVAVGDVYRVGTARVQVSNPRTPCFKLGLRAGSARFIRSFLTSGRLGFYLRVLEEGEVGAGDAIERVSRPSRPLFLDELIRLLYARPVDPAALEFAITSGGLDPSLRQHLEEVLAETRSNPF